MPDIVVQIDRIVDDSFPGFVACSLIDAMGNAHVFVEKSPVVTNETLSARGRYPKQGHIACRVLREWTDEDGRVLAHVDTETPWHVASIAGKRDFVILAAQLLRAREG